jgi:hypothetical protein
MLIVGHICAAPGVHMPVEAVANSFLLALQGVLCELELCHASTWTPRKWPVPMAAALPPIIKP